MASARFKNLIEEHNIEFVSSTGDPEDLGRRFNNVGYSCIKMLRDLMNHAIEIGADVWQKTEAACKDADLLIHTFTHAVGAPDLPNEDFVHRLRKICSTLGHRSYARGAQAFSRLQAIGNRIHMSLAIISFPLTILIKRQLNFSCCCNKENHLYVLRWGAWSIVMLKGMIRSYAHH